MCKPQYHKKKERKGQIEVDDRAGIYWVIWALPCREEGLVKGTTLQVRKSALAIVCKTDWERGEPLLVQHLRGDSNL
jgi:hypothetical protein